jgi:diguanylate cyclase (GGDEF)-like protein
MTKPSDFSPAAALEMKDSPAAKESRRARWLLRGVGVAVLGVGWAAVSLRDVGTGAFIVDSVVFVAMALYAFTAAAVSRIHAVSEERKIRLGLLVHNLELENMSMRDELTQVFNRRYLFDRLGREVDTAKGFERPLAYIAMEVRSLAHLNDTYGYEAGDEILAAFGRFLMDCTRASDIPARASGNKFGVILPDTSKRGAYTMVERLAQSMSTSPLIGDAKLDGALIVSFGVSGFPWGADSAGAIIQQAEIEMASQTTDLAGADLAAVEEPEVPAVFRKVGEATPGS